MRIIKILFFIHLLSYGLLAQTGLKVVDERFGEDYFNNVVDQPVLYRNGILFTYLGKKNERVYLSGDFNDWQKKIKLTSNNVGIYYVLLKENLAKGSYRYRFLVNGYWINDPEQTKITISPNGQRVSTFEITEDLLFSIKSPVKVTDQVYRFYLPDKNYQKVHWLSRENHWDFQADPMVKKGDYWIIDKNLFQEKTFYIFWADGEYVLDPFNISLVNSGFGLVVNFFNAQ